MLVEIIKKSNIERHCRRLINIDHPRYNKILQKKVKLADSEIKKVMTAFNLDLSILDKTVEDINSFVKDDENRMNYWRGHNLYALGVICYIFDKTKIQKLNWDRLQAILYAMDFLRRIVQNKRLFYTRYIKMPLLPFSPQFVNAVCIGNKLGSFTIKTTTENVIIISRNDVDTDYALDGFCKEFIDFCLTNDKIKIAHQETICDRVRSNLRFINTELFKFITI